MITFSVTTATQEGFSDLVKKIVGGRNIHGITATHLDAITTVALENMSKYEVRKDTKDTKELETVARVAKSYAGYKGYKSFQKRREKFMRGNIEFNDVNDLETWGMLDNISIEKHTDVADYVIATDYTTILTEYYKVYWREKYMRGVDIHRLIFLVLESMQLDEISSTKKTLDRLLDITKTFTEEEKEVLELILTDVHLSQSFVDSEYMSELHNKCMSRAYDIVVTTENKNIWKKDFLN